MKGRPSEEKSFLKICGGMVGVDVDVGNHTIENPNLGRGSPAPGAPEAQSSKIQNTGQARSSLRLKTRQSPGSLLGRLQSFPTHPEQGAGWHLGLWFAARF